MKKEILWDRLAGEVDIFVKNYILTKQKSTIKPTYKVTEDLPIEKLMNAKSWEDMYVNVIGGCENINDLPKYVKQVVIACLPRFFEKYPQYKGEKSLQVAK